MNDGLGPRTNKSGLVAEAFCAVSNKRSSVYRVNNESTKCLNSLKRLREGTRLMNSVVVSSRGGQPGGHHQLSTLTMTNYRRNELVGSSSSYSSYDSSSETSEFQSDCQDDEEIALAMQAAEIANRNQIRAKFQ